MQLTREADYAVRIVLDLAVHADDRPARSADVARRQVVPRPFLRKVVQALARRGYVTTRRGTGGGIALARSPQTITLRQIVEAVDGPIALNRCLTRPRACPLDRRCPVHPIWRDIQSVILDKLDAVTFADLSTHTHREGSR